MVQLLTVADVESYVALRKAMLVETPWAFTASPESDRGSDAELVRARLARPGYAIAGAFWGSDGATERRSDEGKEKHDELVAAATVMREELPKRMHIAWLVGVYTRPAFRGRGLGRSVVIAALDAARDWPGVACVQLGVSEGAPEARALYESLGFVTWGAEPDALRVDGRGYAETHMRLVL